MVSLLPFVGRQTTLLLFTLAHIVAFSTIISMAKLNSTISIDQVALLAIKSKIKDDPRGVMSSWNDSLHFCQWQGVACNDRHERVIVLNLSSRGLVGSLSPWVGNLSFLKVIGLQNNSLNGEIPPQVGRLFRLQELRLNNNSFEGIIPRNLSYCLNLKVLQIGHNKLVGKIPNGFGSLTMLNLLIMHRNKLTGGIPPFIANLTSLETLSLGGCNLGGSIPDIFHRLQNLTRLAIPENNLVGTIPPSLYNLSLLETLFLDNNQLHSTLPINLGSLQPRLQELSLPDNLFTGPLPASIFNSTELLTVDVSRNKLSGKITVDSGKVCNLIEVSVGSNSFGSGESDEMNFMDTLANCSKLEVLDIGNNHLKGFLPESLEKWSTKLYFLRLASNSISGSLPSSIGNLSGLTTLDLSGNQFMGTIPKSLGKLRNLQKLNLKENNLAGNIPSSLGDLSLLIELHMGSNKFNGTIPSSLGNCKKLIGLTLDENLLSGIIPRKLFGLSSLSISLNLGSNHLSGQLPSDVGNNLKNLNELVLAENRLSGELPSSLGSCSSLQTIDIGGNFFQGSLPRSLSSLRALQNLDVSCNNFTGPVPSFLVTIPLENLNISFNGFEGEVSSKGVFANANAIIIKGNAELCGGIPELQLPKCRPNHSKGKNKLNLAVISVISLAAVLSCAAMASAAFIYWQKKKGQGDTSNAASENSIIQVSYKMLYNATEGFSLNNVIGNGIFSSVYRALDLYGGIVAVKVLNLHHRGGSKSFISECELLRNVRHRNLVRVITCCSSIDFQGNEFKALLYVFMPNGSLDTWLHSSHRMQNMQNELPRLSLLQRVCIALDVAYALDYLHDHNGRTIVHCDLKPSNILLDEDMVAHVGDFGLSRILQLESPDTHNNNTIGVRGTIGYAAPEYGTGSGVSTSGDIYSYGILLLEMMTSKRPTDPIFQDGLNLHNYSSTAMGDQVLEIVDPILLNDSGRDLTTATNKDREATRHTTNKVFMRLMLKIGVACSMESPQHRMDINSVIQELSLLKDAMLGTSTGFYSTF